MKSTTMKIVAAAPGSTKLTVEMTEEEAGRTAVGLLNADASRPRDDRDNVINMPKPPTLLEEFWGMVGSVESATAQASGTISKPSKYTKQD